MLSDVFYWLLNMSISASIAGCIVILLGKIQKIPRRVIQVLWVIPLFRMWIPFGMNSKYSLMSLLSHITTKSVTVYEGIADFSMMNSVMAADSYFPITYKVNLLKTVCQVAGIIWLIIMAVLLHFWSMVYVITKNEIKNASHLRDNIYLSDKVTSPAAYGILRAKIVIPEIYDEQNYPFTLLHENAHIERKDNLWRVIAIITASLHWFNPLSWIFLKIFLEQLELACDETVLAQCNETEKKEYAATLVRCAENTYLFASAFGGAKLRPRIDRILSYKKISVFSTVCFILFALMVCYVLMTNAA